MSALLFCLVVAVSDGDTLTARCGQPGSYQEVKVRLAEIDAPECRRNHNRALVGSITVPEMSLTMLPQQLSNPLL